ncbi:MAG: flagellar biosynthesis anti-sigma factor FlgM [Candidatus Coatesbacteria bacterium]|nr:flagellar biosynthesis anti-sigma factor FlgM [Candidatus Coatesbacteria bacterium]
MKIEGNIPSQAVDSYRKVDAPKQAEVNRADKAAQGQNISGKMSEEVSDQVSISSEAKLRALAHGALEQIPDVRQDRVEKLSKLIESGQYNPSAEKIAEKMLNNSISIKV